MFEIINPIAVLVATLIGYFLGWAWYSPLLFQKVWMEARGDNGSNSEQNGKKEMPRIIAYGFATTLATAFSMAVFLSITGANSLTEAFQIGLLLCFGFVVTLKFGDLIYTNIPPHWGKRAQTVFIIDTGYQIALFTILSTVIWYISNL